MGKKRRPNRIDASPERARHARLQRQQGEIFAKSRRERPWAHAPAPGPSAGQGDGHEVGK